MIQPDIPDIDDEEPEDPDEVFFLQREMVEIEKKAYRNE